MGSDYAGCRDYHRLHGVGHVSNVPSSAPSQLNSRVAGVEMRGTSIEPPDLEHWGFTTRSSWFNPSHPTLILAVTEH